MVPGQRQRFAPARQNRARVPRVCHDELVASHDRDDAGGSRLGTLPRPFVVEVVLEVDVVAVGSGARQDGLTHLGGEVAAASTSVGLAGELVELVFAADVQHVGVHGEEGVNQTLGDVAALVRLALLEHLVKMSGYVHGHLERVLGGRSEGVTSRLSNTRNVVRLDSAFGATGAGFARTSLPPWPSYTPKKAVSSSSPKTVE